MWKQNTTLVNYGPGVEVETPMCSLTFNIPEDIGPPVLFYYRLTNFYQNHRRYVKSLDSAQLKGEAVPASSIDGGSCTPLELDPNGKPYYPCGLIANSLFNDTFHSPIRVGSANNSTYPMTNKGIAWDSDKVLYGPTKYRIEDIAVPPNWVKRYPDGKYTADNPPPNLEQDEAFHVWMRTAGLPTFSKLALRNDNETMRSGMYQVDIGLSTHGALSVMVWQVLTPCRFPGHRVWRHEIHRHLYKDRYGRQKPFSRYRLYSRWRHMHPAWFLIHSDTSHQAKVGFHLTLECLGTSRADHPLLQKTWRPHLPDLEQ